MNITVQSPNLGNLNDARAERACVVLKYYKRDVLVEAGMIDSEVLTDLLSDIFHWMEREGYSVNSDFPEITDIAIAAWKAESDEATEAKITVSGM